MPGSEITFRSDMRVGYIQHMGTDHLFAEAARQSGTYKGTDEQVLIDAIRDEKLINKLLPQRHTSPFEHSGLTVWANVPLFVSRECERHRTQSYSEMSLRYSEATPEFWLPSDEHGILNDGTKMRPKRGFTDIPHGEYFNLKDENDADMAMCYDYLWQSYQRQLARGVHQEVARAVLPLATYTRFWATANAINWLRFLSLRTHEPEAAVVSYPQWEIEQAARQVEEVFEGLWPVTYRSWVESGRCL